MDAYETKCPNVIKVLEEGIEDSL